jgi:hypothetical protein
VFTATTLVVLAALSRLLLSVSLQLYFLTLLGSKYLSSVLASSAIASASFLSQLLR